MPLMRSLQAAALALAVAALGANGAAAQDYGAYPPSFDWTGVYAGVFGGLSPTEFPNVLADTTLQGGVVAGYTMRLGPGVVGAELEGAYLGGKSHDTGGAGELEQSWTAMAKLKAGLAVDSTLLYATGGYGFARLDSAGDVISDDQWHGGWVLGAGLEQALGPNLSAKLEYTQMRLDDVETIVRGGFRHSDDLVNHSIKAGINFRF